MRNRVRLIPGDCRRAMRLMAHLGVQVDSIVTDPPYHLTSIVKRFGADGAAPARDRDGLYKRASAGFMGKKWDGGDVAFDPETWKLAAAVLKPGGHLLAFGGTRGWHRMACAIEDAGFEIRDTISWNFGSGFPKSHNVTKRLKESGAACVCNKTIVSSHYVREENLRDLQKGLDAFDTLSGEQEQDVLASLCSTGDKRSQDGEKQKATDDPVRDMRETGASATVENQASERSLLQRHMPLENLCEPDQAVCREHEGSETGTAIRPEQPSMEGRNNVQKAEGKLHGSEACSRSGVGASDGEEGRIHHGAQADNGSDVRLSDDAHGSGKPHRSSPSEQPTDKSGNVADERRSQAWGGWPVCGGCGKPVVPEGFGTALKPAMELICLARKPLSEKTVAANVLAHGTGAVNVDGCRVESDDLDGAARVHNGAIYDGVHEGYQRPGRSNYTHKTDWKADSQGRWPANIVHDGSDEVEAAFAAFGGAGGGNGKARLAYGLGGNGILHGGGKGAEVASYADSGTASRFFYSAKADKTDRFGSKHPTVKPVSLMRWLVRLVTPPGGLILDPFAGSGSTGIAAIAEGLRAVLIEAEPEYQADIRERLAWLAGEGRHSASVKQRHRDPPKSHGPLFAEAAE